MRLIDADKGLISKIQLKTGSNFITAQEIVDSMPTIEERKQGEWKSLKGEYGIDYVKCSCCNINSIDQRAYAPMNYCPNCGSKMSDIPTGSN